MGEGTEGAQRETHVSDHMRQVVIRTWLSRQVVIRTYCTPGSWESPPDSAT